MLRFIELRLGSASGDVDADDVEMSRCGSLASDGGIAANQEERSCHSSKYAHHDCLLRRRSRAGRNRISRYADEFGFNIDEPIEQTIELDWPPQLLVLVYHGKHHSAWLRERDHVCRI